MIRWLLGCGFFLLVFRVFADAPIIEADAAFHPVVGRGGMVVSQERLASQVGAAILDRGGNAVDAAVATGFALAVTLPQAGNLGGGGFMLIYLAERGETVAIDYREMAPAAAHRDLFLNRNGAVDPQKARFSHLSSGVPGTVAGLVETQRKYGKLSLASVLKPAIKLAAEGFRVDYPLAYSLRRAADWLRKNPAARRYFFKRDGSLLRAGDIWRQPDLAKTLKHIARNGAEGFYQGPVADLLVAEMQRGNGLITHEDLLRYRVVERSAITGRFHDYRIVSMPPPSSGGVHLIQMLNILEGWDLATLGHNSGDYLHRLIEVMRRAYADRSEYLGDPDFYRVPLKKLLDRDYADRLRKGIDLKKSSRSEAIRPGLELPEESPQTTHFSVWDTAGNVVSNTYTLNFSYGNGIAVPGAGFLLNNEMDDFSAKPGVPNAYGLVGNEANAIAAGKRPLSSMTPVIVFKGNKPLLATGSPGGSTIITAVLQTLLNVMVFDMNIAEATAASRIHHQWLPDLTLWEPGISVDTRERLKIMGHRLPEQPRLLGKTQSIVRDTSADDSPFFFGASDNRWPGGAAVPVVQ